MKQSAFSDHRRLVPAMWLGLFVFLSITSSTMTPPGAGTYLLLALSGTLYCAIFARRALVELLQEHRLIFGALLILTFSITTTEALHTNLPAWRFLSVLPSQAGLVLCLLPLALFLGDRHQLRWLILVFSVLCAYHFVALPVEAVTGSKSSWFTAPSVPRNFGPLHFQASGLALDSYFYPGFFLPLFYLAWGPLYERRVVTRPPLSRRTLICLAVLWLIPTACVQSRSALFGAAAATTICLAYSLRARPGPKTWAFLAGTVAVAALVYLQLFSENKSGPGLRWIYANHYLTASLQWPAILTGHGFRLLDLDMLIPGMQPISHSHNDLVQILFSWGLIGLVAYIGFWAGLLRLIYVGFWKDRRYWPLSVLAAMAPNFVTDLGFQHLEKAICLIFFAAFCMVLRGRGAGAKVLMLPPEPHRQRH